MSATTHSFVPMVAVAEHHTVAKCRDTSLICQTPWEAVGGRISTTEMDFMRSATAMMAGESCVEGVTDRESGFVEVRYDASLLSSRDCFPRVVEGTRP